MRSLKRLIIPSFIVVVLGVISMVWLSSTSDAASRSRRYRMEPASTGASGSQPAREDKCVCTCNYTISDGKRTCTGCSVSGTNCGNDVYTGCKCEEKSGSKKLGL